MTRLLLVRHAATPATQRRAFAGDEPITEDSRAAVARLASHLPSGAAVVSSPALRCRQTAEALGLQPRLDADLAECDFGSWEGRTFAEISAREPELTRGWLRDADAAPHGGESLRGFAARVAAWLDGAARGPGTTILAVTHAGVVKAAVVHALGAPLAAFWRVAAEPLSITELDAHESAWTLVRSNWQVPA